MTGATVLIQQGFQLGLALRVEPMPGRFSQGFGREQQAEKQQTGKQQTGKQNVRSRQSHERAPQVDNVSRADPTRGRRVPAVLRCAPGITLTDINGSQGSRLKSLLKVLS